MIPSLVGHFTIAISVLFCALLVPDEDLRRPMWFFIYLAVAFSAHFCWIHPEAPTSPINWLKSIWVAIAAGTVLALIDVVVYGTQSGHVALDLCLVIIGVLIAVSGALRSAARGEGNDV